jgi:hypothetical protein
MIGMWLSKVFGPSWRTTLYSILIGGGNLALIIGKQGRIPTEQEWLISIGIIFFGYNSKDKDITGGP